MRALAYLQEDRQAIGKWWDGRLSAGLDWDWQYPAVGVALSWYPDRTRWTGRGSVRFSVAVGPLSGLVYVELGRRVRP